jgi:hypothetical protein
MFEAVQKKLVKTLREDKRIRELVQRVMTIRGVGEVMALTWVLEIGESSRRAKPSVTAVYAAPSGNRQGKNDAGLSPRSGTNICKRC